MDFRFSRRRTFGLLSLFSILSFARLGSTQEVDIAKYPSRPITFNVAVSAGGPTDLCFRLVSKEAEKLLGQPIVVVNKAGLAIGMSSVAVAKPDGYTVGHSSNSALLLMPYLEKMPFDTLKDFRHIIQVAAVNFGIYVKADSPFKTFKDVVAYAAQNPGKITYGGPMNSIHYFITEQIAKKEKIKFTHIPFKGSPEATTALLGGHIVFGTGDFNYSLLEAGQIRLLLLLREERSSEYPKTPILKDLGYDDIPAPYYLGICGPKGIPDGIVLKLEDAFKKAMNTQAYIDGMKELRLPIVYRDHRALDDYVARNYELFGQIVKDIQKK